MRERTPSKALKLALRVPSLVYAAGLGRLLGRRFALLVHRGRRSGLERRVVLEVVAHESEPPSLAVVSGWGERSQWYRNLRASPPVAVVSGGERWPEPSCEFLDPDGAAAALERYRSAHPLATWLLERFLGWPRGAGVAERRRLARELRVVVFRPSGAQAAPAAAAISR